MRIIRSDKNRQNPVLIDTLSLKKYQAINPYTIVPIENPMILLGHKEPS